MISRAWFMMGPGIDNVEPEVHEADTSMGETEGVEGAGHLMDNVKKLELPRKTLLTPANPSPHFCQTPSCPTARRGV